MRYLESCGGFENFPTQLPTRLHLTALDSLHPACTLTLHLTLSLNCHPVDFRNVQGTKGR
ncbi:uncharacterized protein BJX67DRAFT_316763 [Aspergillus lucknowensis]|uniref:Uncharacterized protein n=1 Tax=Aspergillus lucknowensis TaxID=176173 RepID=A0ABR4L9P4_9EURO